MKHDQRRVFAIIAGVYELGFGIWGRQVTKNIWIIESVYDLGRSRVVKILTKEGLNNKTVGQSSKVKL